MEVLIQPFITIPYAIEVAVYCSVLIALVLVMSRYAPASLKTPGSRFKISVATGWFFFLAALSYGLLFNLQMDVLDVFAGVSIVLSATIITFIFWSLVVWGFTLNMLLAITALENPVSLDDWIKQYLGEKDTNRLTADRMKILLAAKFAHLDQDQTYNLTRSGYFGTRIYRFARGLFGVTTDD